MGDGEVKQGVWDTRDKIRFLSSLLTPQLILGQHWVERARSCSLAQAMEGLSKEKGPLSKSFESIYAVGLCQDHSRLM